MKKRTFLMNLFMALSVFAFVACNNDDVTYVPAKMAIEGADEYGACNMSFGNKVGEKTFNVTATGDWHIRIDKEDASWLSVNPSEGSASASPVTITVKVKANDKTENRTSLIALVCDNVEQKALVKVSQEQLYTLSAIASKKLINKKGGEVAFTINTNADEYNYSIDAEGQTWLTVKSKEDKKLVLNAAEMGAEERKAVITFTTPSDATLKEVVEISQKDMYLDPTYNFVDVDLAGGDAVIDLSTNVEWKYAIAEEDADWLTGVASDNKLTLTAAAFSAGRREAVITLSSPVDEALTTTVTLIQTPKLLMDIVFNADGTAEDASNNHFPVIYTADNTKLNVAWNEAYAKYVPSFKYVFANSGSGVGYRVQYGNEYVAQLADGHSLEALVMTTNNGATGESKALSSTQSGGTALLIHSAARNNTLGFAAHINGGWKFVVSSVVPTAGVYYHVVCVWDKANGVGKVYINGQLNASDDTFTGNFKEQQLTSKAFGVGYNSTGAPGNYNGAWVGDVVISRVYDAVLTDSDVSALYNAAKVK